MLSVAPLCPKCSTHHWGLEACLNAAQETVKPGPNTVSPLCLRIMLACHVSPDPKSVISERVWNSSAGIEIRQWLLNNTLINGNYQPTPRGKAWVQFLCETPLPVATWKRP